MREHRPAISGPDHESERGTRIENQVPFLIYPDRVVSPGERFRELIGDGTFSIENMKTQTTATKGSKAQTPSPKPPKGSVIAKLIPSDAAWIERNLPDDCPLWIFTGILAQVGLEAVRRPEGPAKVRATPSHFLWQCINRDAANYTEEIPVYLIEEELLQVTDDAEAMGRDIGDWMGSLIRVGIQIYAKVRRERSPLDYLVGFRAVELLGKEAELEIERGS